MKTHKSLELYNKKVTLGRVTHAMPTKHIKKDRLKRVHRCMELNRFDDNTMGDIDRVFDATSDDGHHTLYAVTVRGIIFVLDKVKFELGYPSVITLYPGKMAQLFYLYKTCGLDVPHKIIMSAKRWD